jgi:hypothetical protein
VFRRSAFVDCPSINCLRLAFTLRKNTSRNAINAMPLFGTEDESTMMQELYALFGDINFSSRVLAAAPEKLAVLKVSGIKWNALGEPGRVLASVQTAGVRPRWAESC